MHLKKQSAPFLKELKPSRRLLGLTACLHFIALLACFLTALPFVIKLSVAICIVVSFSIAYQRLQSKSLKLGYTEKNGWEIDTGNGFESVDVLGSTVVTFCIVFLHLKNKPPIIIANDSLDENDFRELIVKLKMASK